MSIRSSDDRQIFTQAPVVREVILAASGQRQKDFVHPDALLGIRVPDCRGQAFCYFPSLRLEG